MTSKPKLTTARRGALAALHERNRGSRYRPGPGSDAEAILGAARAIVANARKGGKPPDPRGLRGLARHLGVSPGTVSRWFAGESWPRPDVVASIRAWMRNPDPPSAHRAIVVGAWSDASGPIRRRRHPAAR